MPKKKWMVIPREKITALTGMVTSFGKRNFHPKTGVAYVDSDEAKEIDQKYGMRGRRDVMVFEDERYSHALNAESWDIKRDNKTGGDYVKTLHHYTQQGVGLKKLSLLEKVQKFRKVNGGFLRWSFGFWMLGPRHPDYTREIGLRLCGKEFVRKY